MAIGKKLPRKDAGAKVDGTAVFVDDMQLGGTLYAAIYRSTICHGNIRRINLQRDFLAQLNAEVIVADDIPGKNIVHIILDDWQLLAKEKVRYYGEPIALIVAPSQKNANAALEAISVEYDELPKVFDPLEARNHPSIKIFEDTNIFSHHKLYTGDIEQGFNESDIVLEAEYQTSAQEHAYLETQGVLAVPEGEGRITIYVSCQCPYYVQGAVAEVLGLNLAKVRVIQTTTGGAFGGKEDIPSQVASFAAVGAWILKKPVKLIYSREEDIEGSSKRHPGYAKIKAGAKNSGELVSLQVEYILDGGAYATLSPAVLWRGTVHATGPYRCPNVKVDSYAVATNKVPFGAFRGFGTPQIIFACEEHLDRVAAKLGMDPAEFRRLNLFKAGDTTPWGQKLTESVGSHETLERALEKANWKEKWKFLNTNNPLQFDRIAGVKRRGIGISTIFYGVGLGAGGDQIERAGAYIQINTDATVNFSVGTTDMGQGMITVLSQIVAEALNLPYDSVEMSPVDTSRTPDSGPTVASRATTMSGRALLKACNKILNRLKTIAAEMLEIVKDDLELERGSFYSIMFPSRSVTIKKVIKEASQRKVSLVAATYDHPTKTTWDIDGKGGFAYITYAWATNIAEVTVDIETGEVTVERITAAHDVGKAINPQQVEGQIEGGTAQGVGYGRFEEVIWNPEGKILSNNLGTFIIGTVLDIPDIDPIIVEHPFPEGPYGAKGFAEQPLMGVAPAITNAIYNACGIRLNQIPATPERVWKQLILLKKRLQEGEQ